MTPASSLTSEIAAANATFNDAFERQDAAALARTYTVGGRLMPANRDPVEGRPAIEAYWRGVMESGAKRMWLEPVEVDSIGDGAYEVGRYALEGDGGVADEGAMLAIWKREDGRWKLHRDIWNTNLPLPRRDGVPADPSERRR